MASARGFFGSLLKRLKRLASAFRERAPVAIDEYVLEHLLLYHGLVGSSPEDQPRFADARADIFAAVKRGSSADLAIALRLPPLWWEGKLDSIFAEAEAQHADNVIACLLPEPKDEELEPSSDPLRHEDWRVRANAARMLASLQIRRAVPRLISALDASSEGDARPAFCHIALALGKLRDSQAQTALARYLYSEEPWFRVDAAAALALFPQEEVAGQLMKAMLSGHELLDYAAVAIARHQNILALVTDSDPVIRAGALEVVIGTVEAARSSYRAEVVLDSGVLPCWPAVLEAALSSGSPRQVRAARALATWIQDNQDLAAGAYPGTVAPPSPHGWPGTPDEGVDKLFTEAGQALAELSGPALADKLAATVRLAPGQDHEADGELRHAIQLIGDLKVVDLAPALSGLLAVDYPHVNEVIDALGALGEPQAAEPLCRLARQIVDIEDRAQQPKSSIPVAEDNPSAAGTYWRILRALGNTGNQACLDILLAAADDFAPDKREQAVQSLIRLYPSAGIRRAEIEKAIAAALGDPSPKVTQAAVSGVGALLLAGEATAVAQLTGVPVVSLRNQAFQTLNKLYDNGFPAQVVDALDARLKTEIDANKRARLTAFLSWLKSAREKPWASSG